MSRGNYFCNNKTKHYFNIPHLNKFGLAYLDAYGYNILRNPANPIAQAAFRITNHGEVGIWNQPINILKWMASEFSVNEWFYVSVLNTGDVKTSRISNERATSLITYVETHTYAEIALDLDNGNADARQIYDIQTSLRGYLEATNSSSSDPDPTPLGIKLFFPRANANRTDRTTATRATTKMQGIPRTKSGRPYHYQQSIASKVGNYVDGGDVSSEDPAASVAGSLKKTWNKVENCWDAGGTFIAMLLEDVDGADIKASTLTKTNVQGRSESDFYGAGAVDRMFEFTTGQAVPVQLQTSKPQSFGPNIMKCSDTKNLEKIRVVNRTRHNFTRGERVLVHQIDGENIIAKYTSDTTEQRPPQPGRWNFTKFFSSSDTYFRFLTDSDTASSRSYYPEEFVKCLYQTHYTNELVGTDSFTGKKYNYAIALNGFVPNTLDSPQYLLSSSDRKYNKFANSQMLDEYVDKGFALYEHYQIYLEDHCNSTGKPYFGGPNARINIDNDPAGTDVVGQQVVQGRDMPLWFGAMFPDGVTQEASLYEYKFDKMQTPASLVYPFRWDSNLSTTRINYGAPEYTTASTDRTTSGILNTNNKQRVQFSFAAPELYCCGDRIAEVNPTVFGVGEAIADAGRFGSARGELRNFPVLCSAQTNGSKGGQIGPVSCGPTLLGPAIMRNRQHITPNTADKFGAAAIGRVNGAMAMMCKGLMSPPAPEYIIPFDCYIDYVPTNAPKNAPALFGGDTGPESTVESFKGGVSTSQFVGANAVSIMSARFRLNQGSGGSWSLNAETNQTFGMKGRFFGGGGGGGITTTIIGAIMAFASDNRGRTVQGSVPMWGSNKGDAIDSFGTAACHVQVWDAWPDELTTWIPQYMCALHFNPSIEISGPLNSQAPTTVTVTNYANATRWGRDTASNYNLIGEWNVAPNEDYKITVEADSEVSFRDPTYGDNVVISYLNEEGVSVSGTYTSYGTNYILDDGRNEAGTSQGADGSAVRAGETLGPGTVLRPNDIWNINRTREAQLVTQYGYAYDRVQIGLSAEKANVEMEEGFVSGSANEYDIGTGEKTARIYIQTGGADGPVVKFSKSKFLRNDGTEEEYKERGVGFEPSDLPYSKTITDSNGKTCTITFNRLLAYTRYYRDVGPKARSGLQRVSMSSGSGTDQVYGNKATSVAVTGNNVGDPENDATLYSGQYEVFVYCHGDIGFMWINEPEATTGYQFAQYITLSLN